METSPESRQPGWRASSAEWLPALSALTLVVVAFAFVLGQGCYMSNSSVHTSTKANTHGLTTNTWKPGSPTAGSMTAAITPGERVGRSLILTAGTLGAGTPVDLSWMPPPGASGFQFVPAASNSGGPPPFLFEDLPLQAAGSPTASVVLSYDAPSGAAAAGLTSLVETYVTHAPDGSSYAGSFKESFGGAGATPAVSAAAVDSGPATEAEGEARAQATTAGWAADVWVDSDGTPMTTSLCQQWVDFFQSGRAFVASRFPAAGSADPRWAPFPLVSRAEDNYWPRLDLERWSPSARILSLPMELTPQRLSFAENELPAAARERWMTFSASSSPTVTCPAGLSITGGYSFRAWVPLDFSALPDGCAGCNLQSFVCYEGDDPPFFMPQAARAAAEAIGLASAYQDSGITCAGPLVVRLVEPTQTPSPPYALDAANSGVVTPPATVTASHLILKMGTANPTFTLAVSSSLGLAWGFYRDSNGAPNLSQPITGPFTTSSSFFSFWAVANVAAHVQGVETLTITLSSTNPVGSTWTADTFWIGGWQSPPEVTPLVAATPEAVHVGDPAEASGTLPNGAYRLAVVPNGTYAVGKCYTGVPTAFADVVIVDGVLAPTVVWQSSEAGWHDLLVLGGECSATGAEEGGVAGSALVSGRTVVTGDDLSSAPGFKSGPPLRRRLTAH